MSTFPKKEVNQGSPYKITEEDEESTIRNGSEVTSTEATPPPQDAISNSNVQNERSTNANRTKENPSSSLSLNDSKVIAPSRKLSVSKYTILDELTPALKELLQCPECRSISVPPIYVCAEGHNVCHLCHPEFPRCSKCNSEFTTKRNELAEVIVSKFHFKCSYQGCTSTMFGYEVQDHLKLCEYRPISCSVHNNIDDEDPSCCKMVIPFHDYFDHLKTKHKIVGVYGSSTIVNMSTTVKLGHGNWTFPPQYLIAFDKTFLCHIHASYNLLIGWISLCGTPEETQNYVGSVTIFNPRQKWKQVKWTGHVHSIRSTSQEVYDSGNCLVLLPETFLLFAQLESVDEDGQMKDIELLESTKSMESTKTKTNNKNLKKWTCHFEVCHVNDLEREQLLLETASMELLQESKGNNDALFDRQKDIGRPKPKDVQSRLDDAAILDI